MSDLYRVTIGEDVYLGTAEEVVAFMARADGAPGHDVASYMEGIALRVRRALDVEIPADDPDGFLEALAAKGVLRVEAQGEPSSEQHDVDEVLGEGLIAFSEDVDPADLDLD